MPRAAFRLPAARALRTDLNGHSALTTPGHETEALPPTPTQGTGVGETMTGTVNDDWFQGLGGNDTLIGLDGADQLEGGDGDDILQGGAGSDLLMGGAGSDQFIGSDAGGPADTDIVSYINETSSVTLDFTAGIIGGAATGDTFTSIEQFTLTNFNDSYNGSAATDRANGAGGDDVILGLAGNDSLRGGAGDDYLDGGANTSSGTSIRDAPMTSASRFTRPWCGSVDLDRHWANGSSSHDGLHRGISRIASPHLTSCDPNRL